MVKGRKRKTANRTKSGRISRAGGVRIDKGTPAAAAKVERYGVNGSDAIGRAYVAGLLGQGDTAKTLLDTARAVSRVYWAWYEIGAPRCTLADRTSGLVVDVDCQREARQEDWLNRMLAVAGPMGFDRRKAFDALVIDPNPDCGPAWLDALIADPANGTGKKWLAVAVDVLCECAGIE